MSAEVIKYGYLSGKRGWNPGSMELYYQGDIHAGNPKPRYTHVCRDKSNKEKNEHSTRGIILINIYNVKYNHYTT